MQLRDAIQIRSRFVRSVHIERDRQIPEALDNYILTKKASEVCSSILSNYINVSSSDRAWTITGPYGTGKSSLALLLLGLVDNSKDKLSKTAHSLYLKEITSEKNNVLRNLPKIGPAAVASLTATPNPLLPQLSRTVSLAVSIACKALGHKFPSHFSHKALEEKFRNRSVEQVVGILEDISLFIVKSGGSGLVIIIDELGKILENALKSNSSSDVYLLQAIAESAARSGKCRLAIVGFLHQSFESYARIAGSSVEREWSKIHGRFADVAYIQSAEEMLNVIAQAFVHDLPSKTAKKIHSWAHEWAGNLHKNGVLLSTPHNTLVRIFQSCYPLSPITALILPLLCQRFAQNDRTMFSLLASDDPSALGGFMIQNKVTFEQDRIVAFTLSRLFDYFVNSRLIMPADPIHLRRWAELQSVLDRAVNGTALELGLLKAIGVLNIIGAYGTLTASTNILKYALNDDGYTGKEIDSALLSLKKRSFIVYRKFSNEWRIWEGSDVDIDRELLQAREKILPGFHAADHLNIFEMLRPIVATRHSYQTGSVRSFEILAASSVEEFLNRTIEFRADASIC